MNVANPSVAGNASGRIYGSFGSVSLNDILQLLGMSRRTATVFIKNHEKEGTILFREGLVLHAAAGAETGESALLRLVHWTEADFIIDEGVPNDAPASINKNVDAVMLDVLTKLDESRLDLDVIFTPATPLDKIDLQELESKVRASRPKPRPPRPRQTGKVVAIAVGAVVTLAASVALVMWQQWTVDADTLPPFTERAQARAPVVRPEVSIATEVLAGTIAPTGADAADVLEHHGLSLTPEPVPSHSATPAAAQPAPAQLGEPTRPAERVEPAPAADGFLLVVAEPWGEVSVDGKAVGQTPLPALELRAGEHELVLSNPGFLGVIRDRVTVRGGETASVRYSFNDHGALRILVTPWADVYVDGRHVGQTPLDELDISVGEHQIRLSHPSLGERTETIIIRRGQSSVLKVEM